MFCGSLAHHMQSPQEALSSAATCMAGMSAAGATQYQGINLGTGASSAGVRAGVIVGIIFVRAPASRMGSLARPHPAAALSSASVGLPVITDMPHSSPSRGAISVQSAIQASTSGSIKHEADMCVSSIRNMSM